VCAPAAPARGGALLDGLTVLVIDNEPAILEGMELLLTGWGCDVIKATDALKALEQLHTLRKSPDIALVDYHLTDGNGVDAVMALRWKLGPLPAVLITADRTRKVRDVAKAADITVLNKPLKPAALRALLAQRRLSRTAAE